jgi:hypothetical protein
MRKTLRKTKLFKIKNIYVQNKTWHSCWNKYAFSHSVRWELTCRESSHCAMFCTKIAKIHNFLLLAHLIFVWSYKHSIFYPKGGLHGSDNFYCGIISSQMTCLIRLKAHYWVNVQLAHIKMISTILRYPYPLTICETFQEFQIWNKIDTNERPCESRWAPGRIYYHIT